MQTPKQQITRIKSELKGVEFLRPGEKRLKGEIATTANKLKEAIQDEMPPKIATLRRLLDELESVMKQPAICPTCGGEVAKHGD